MNLPEICETRNVNRDTDRRNAAAAAAAASAARPTINQKGREVFSKVRKADRDLELGRVFAIMAYQLFLMNAHEVREDGPPTLIKEPGEPQEMRTPRDGKKTINPEQCFLASRALTKELPKYFDRYAFSDDSNPVSRARPPNPPAVFVDDLQEKRRQHVNQYMTEKLTVLKSIKNAHTIKFLEQDYRDLRKLLVSYRKDLGDGDKLPLRLEEPGTTDVSRRLQSYVQSMKQASHAKAKQLQSKKKNHKKVNIKSIAINTGSARANR